MKNLRTLFLSGLIVLSGVFLTGCEKNKELTLEEKNYQIEFNESEEVLENYENELDFLLDEEGNIETELSDLEIIEFEEIETEIENLEAEADALLEEEDTLEEALNDLESLDF